MFGFCRTLLQCSTILRILTIFLRALTNWFSKRRHVLFPVRYDLNVYICVKKRIKGLKPGHFNFRTALEDIVRTWAEYFKRHQITNRFFKKQKSI